ncbi:Galactose/lactose metabolism regulatory protein GAL80 [Cytospora mali]|uniref:Galactose/lactose metabolism regulatory protein GAL80 n=1 Tax=Cytospora mali TaxID=578113 RepID=A0A194VTN4_CYTMA|nr:Galactose/lactose metabolism regulatory protein GAL80 [Valsa mali]
MAPIRLAIIGLSTSATTSWASSAHLPYLLSERGRSKYSIVALCNSSVESAKTAIKTYGLDAEKTRAYGDAKALAADPDVDLVVCCTRVDTHYALIRPSIAAGKAAFVEWPLTHDVQLSRELADLVAEKGVRSMVGLQGRLAPVVGKVKELVEEGSLGKVLSSEVRGFGGTVDRELLASGLAYSMERKVGGNILMIGFAHMFDYVQSVLGEAIDLHPQFQLQRPEVKLRDPSTNTIVGTTVSDVPDLITVTGVLKNTSIVQHGASLLVHLRRGQPFKGEPALSWHINCEKGEIRLTAPSGIAIQAMSYSEPVTIDVHHFSTDEIHNVRWEWPKWQEESNIPVTGRSIAKLYESFYAEFSGDGQRDYPDFADALSRHEQLISILSHWDSA